MSDLWGRRVHEKTNEEAVIEALVGILGPLSQPDMGRDLMGGTVPFREVLEMTQKVDREKLLEALDGAGARSLSFQDTLNLLGQAWVQWEGEDFETLNSGVGGQQQKIQKPLLAALWVKDNTEDSVIGSFFKAHEKSQGALLIAENESVLGHLQETYGPTVKVLDGAKALESSTEKVLSLRTLGEMIEPWRRQKQISENFDFLFNIPTGLLVDQTGVDPKSPYAKTIFLIFDALRAVDLKPTDFDLLQKTAQLLSHQA